MNRRVLHGRPRTAGFTFIELLASLAIIATLASVAFPMVELSVKRDKEKELRRALREIRLALDAYKQAGDEGRIVRSADESGYPPTLAALVEGVEDQKDPARRRIVFLRRVPRDPFSPDNNLPSDRTWAVRSYFSPASNPQPGRDVFDVYSVDPGIGLNKVPYREW